MTDHQPLTAIFHPEKGIPAMTAARMLRYALPSPTHDYEITYRTSAKHANADGLSKLPMYGNRENATESDVMDVFYMNHVDVYTSPHQPFRMSAARIRFFRRFWKDHNTGGHKSALTVWSHSSPNGVSRVSSMGVSIMWGIRVVVPHKLRN